MFLLAHSACFLRPPRIMGPGWYCPSGLGPPHWSLVRKMSHRLRYGRGIFSIEVPSFQMTLAHAKLTQNSSALLLTSLYTLQFQEHFPDVSSCGLEGTDSALCERMLLRWPPHMSSAVDFFSGTLRMVLVVRSRVLTHLISTKHGLSSCNKTRYIPSH